MHHVVKIVNLCSTMAEESDRYNALNLINFVAFRQRKYLVRYPASGKGFSMENANAARNVIGF